MVWPPVVCTLARRAHCRSPESRWPVAAEALEQSMLESKDKEQLLAIAQALGIKTTSRAAKATLIDKILETTGGGSPDGAVTAVEQRPRHEGSERAGGSGGRHRRRRGAEGRRRTVPQRRNSPHRRSKPK